MTREEAIDILRVINPPRESKRVFDEFMQARDMAIEALSAEPCEDAVSKEAVSEWLKQYGQDVLHGKYKFSLMYIWKNLMDLPSAQPEPNNSLTKPNNGLEGWISCSDCEKRCNKWETQ